jgi:hypothetical protein
MPVVMHTPSVELDEEAFGQPIYFGSDATIDSGGVDIRGVDEGIVTVAFSQTDLPLIAHVVLEGWDCVEVSDRRVKFLSTSTTYTEDDLIRIAFMYLAAVKLRRSAQTVVAAA